MRRRTFLTAAAAAAALGTIGYSRMEHLPVSVDYPGRSAGHRLRDGVSDVRAGGTAQRFDVVVVGSGIAGLSAAWKLARQGVKNVALLTGPEHYGNAAAVHRHDLAYPSGAHYLPLPSMESMHVREMLSDFGVILSDPYGERPTYDERYVLHAPGDRVLFDGQWQDGYLPVDGVPAAERDQHARFFALMDQYASARGSDGRRGFAVPIELASSDQQFVALDESDFDSWLDARGFSAPTLRWYLDYCCRDDYGRHASEVSAYAGIAYFASRGGEASNAERGAVLTFPEGLAALATHLETGAMLKPANLISAMATRIESDGERISIEGVLLDQAARFEPIRLSAKAVVVAMPLFVAGHVVPALASMGFSAALHAPRYAPWMVSSFIMSDFPEERPGSALSWDNVVYNQPDLGYVVSTHQDIRQSKPEKTAFTAYSALADMPIDAARRWLDGAPADALLARASRDLKLAYGWRLGPCVESVEITVRGHAMASPAPGFLSNQGMRALRHARGAIQFAHADLSGYSVFEEAAWWGVRAADSIAPTLR
jgi:hypothetical protein